MNGIPRTFCVTLRETPKRKEEAQKYFEEIGLKAEMFDGLHGASFGVKPTIPNYTTLPGREYFITQGAVGCILSHLTLWNVLQHQPEDEFLIVEDDVTFCEGFAEKFAQFKSELPDDWEFVYVGWYPIGGGASDNFIRVTDNITIRPVNCTHAYMVKKSALQKLIDTNQLASDTLDNQIRNRSFSKLHHYTFEPSLVTQRSVKNIEDTTWFSQCYDWGVNPEWLKDISGNPVLMGSGWYPLEKNDEGYMIWTDGRGEFLFDDEWTKMKIDFIAEGEMERKLTVVCPMQPDQVFPLKLGVNSITVDIGGTKSAILVTDTFKPSDIYKTADCRRLGIRLLKEITLFDKTGKGRPVSLYSMYGQKKFDGAKRNDGVKVIKTKYSHEDGKINIGNQIYFSHHRSGWEYVLNVLLPYHKEEATIFDGFLENTFAWNREQNSQMRIIPYREPWVGVFHNPPNSPSWFNPTEVPSAILATREFQDSLGMCKGIYTLSKYHADFLRCFIKAVPVEVLYHPTEIPKVVFDYEKFIQNTNKKVVNVGYHLRKLSSIYQLNVDKDTYQKVRLLRDTSYVEHYLEIEQSMTKNRLTEDMMKSVIDLRYMGNDEYDELLSMNIAFLDLYDSSANNIIIECIARGTPILVNPLPAVVEYLGEGYPFYFITLADAAKKLKNVALIKEAHEYLKTSGVSEKLISDYFLKTLREGRIWKSLI